MIILEEVKSALNNKNNVVISTHSTTEIVNWLKFDGWTTRRKIDIENISYNTEEIIEYYMEKDKTELLVMSIPNSKFCSIRLV